MSKVISEWRHHNSEKKLCGNCNLAGSDCVLPVGQVGTG